MSSTPTHSSAAVTTVDDDPTSALLDRLSHLEHLTSPSLAANTHPREDASDSSSSSRHSLVKSLQRVQDRLQRCMVEKKAVGDFVFRYNQLRPLLTPDSSSDADTDRAALLDVAAKKDLVLSAESELLLVAEELRMVECPEGELDRKGVLDNLPINIRHLSTLESSIVLQRSKENATQRKLAEILDSYNHFINNLSDIFICYDDVISDLELKVARVERGVEV